MDHTLKSLMHEATRLTQSGRLNEATSVIQRALGGLGGESNVGRAAGSADVIDGCVFESAPVQAPRPRLASSRPVAAAPRPTGPGEFIAGSFSHASRSSDYKLYVPPGATAGRPMPLVVMLHGCTQNPDDFACGTGMNDFARDQGFYVLYPAQAKSANPQGCWNWFKHNHQERERGEPALIAGLTREVMRAHAIDPRRVYIAGLSAGGAMAAVVAQVYPELFAAVGIHSGLPTGAAGNLSEALSAMNGSAAAPSPTRGRTGQRHLPAIVFHGDQDATVHPRNGEHLVAAAAGADAVPRVEKGVSSSGKRYTRSVHVDARGEALAEHWLVHGAGHAWSGGQPAGSYTDAQGPSATQEMLRFFFEHPHADPRPL